MCRAENTLKCKDFRAEGQTRKGDSYTYGKTATPARSWKAAGGFVSQIASDGGYRLFQDSERARAHGPGLADRFQRVLTQSGLTHEFAHCMFSHFA